MHDRIPAHIVKQMITKRNQSQPDILYFPSWAASCGALLSILLVRILLILVTALPVLSPVARLATLGFRVISCGINMATDGAKAMGIEERSAGNGCKRDLLQNGCTEEVE